MKKTTRTIAIAGLALATVGTLTACSTGGSGWEDEVRASVRADWNTSTDAENAEGCDAMQTLGMDTPEALTAFIMPMAGDMTPADYADMGIPLGSEALNGVDTKEIILVAADEMVDLCNFDGEPKASENVAAPNTEVGEDHEGDYAQTDAGTTPTQTAAGEIVAVGDWNITVTNVDTDVDAQRWDSYNEDAKGQYVSVEWNATYAGTARNADTFTDLSWTFYGADGTVYHEAGIVNSYDANGTVNTTVRPGGTVQYMAVFDVPATALEGGYVSVEVGYTGDYADFSIA